MISRPKRSANIWSEVSHPDPQRAGPTPPSSPSATLEQTRGRNHLLLIPGLFASLPLPRQVPPRLSCARSQVQAGSASQRRLRRSLPTSHYSAEPRDVPKSQIIPLPWKKVWEELLFGRLGIASKGQILDGSQICGLRWLVRSVSRQIWATRGIKQLFSQRGCSHPFSTRYLVRKRDAFAANAP